MSWSWRTVEKATKSICNFRGFSTYCEKVHRWRIFCAGIAVERGTKGERRRERKKEREREEEGEKEGERRRELNLCFEFEFKCCCT